MTRRSHFDAAMATTPRRSGSGTARAFSLIELLAVIAILAIVVTLFWGSNPAQKQKAKLKACKVNLQKVFVAMEIYAGEYRGVYPARTGAKTAEDALSPLVPRYAADTGVFLCPGSADKPLRPGESLDQGRISYAYYMGCSAKTPGVPLLTDRQVDTLPKTSGALAFSDTGEAPANNHDKSGGNILFIDGRVETSPARLPFALVLTQGVVLLNPKP